MALENMKRGGVYDVYWPRSRNLRAAVYDGSGGFIGIRTKFGERYLFTEYSWYAPYNGTVSRVDPVRHLIVYPLPAGLSLSEYSDDGTVCSVCQTPARWTGERRTEGGKIIAQGGPWVCEGGCKEALPAREPNTELFRYLEAVEATETEAGRWR